MKLGIFGLPASGKTTVFNALTGENLTTGTMSSGGRLEVHTAVVDVPDLRVEKLSAFYKPKKTTHAKVTYADIGGLETKTGSEGIPGPLLNQLSQMDGLVHVVRVFDNPAIPHSAGSIDPRRDIETLETEFILNDMLVVERRLAKLAEERQKGGGRDKGVVEREIQLFERLQERLGDERPLRGMECTEEENLVLSGFGLLTKKPQLILLNMDENDTRSAEELAGSMQQGVQALTLQGALEMEIAQLSGEEAAEFLAEYGIEQPGRERVIQASYDLLQLQSFFTVGEDEVRAWTITRTATALDAAGTIHSDLARGFIRAEVIDYQELLDLDGLAEARKQGRLRTEGKTYTVQDGEVVHIRFNI
ncbi:MAG: redox-regulated ATPase YchF [Anaerolineales bacterium]|nr:redox-regulated ATPase YchF [Anaerolineales bacterium]